MSIGLVNPLSPNSFPNSTHLCTFSTCHILGCSAPTTFAPLGPDLGGQVHMESPLGQNCSWQPRSLVIGGQSGEWTDSHAGPPLQLDWTGTSHTIRVHVFLSAKCPLWGHQSGLWISLNPKHQGGCTPFHPHKPKGCLVGGTHQNLTKCFSLWPKLGPKPSKAHLWYWDLRPQNRTKSTSTCTTRELVSQAVLGEAVHQVHHTVYMDVLCTGSTSCALQDIGMGYGVP